MIGLLCFVLAVLASPFRSKLRLEAENAVLRHQLIVLKRRLRGRVRLTNNDRWFFIQLYRWFPSILKVLTIIRPQTLVRWHRAGFRCYWRWMEMRGRSNHFGWPHTPLQNSRQAGSFMSFPILRMSESSLNPVEKGKAARESCPPGGLCVSGGLENSTGL